MRYEWTLFIAFFLLHSCKGPDITIDNLNNGVVKVVGHGGSGYISTVNSYHPNSLEAHIRALEYYAIDGVETDLQVSADSVLYMFHDRTLESVTTCFGCIAGIVSPQLANCVYKNSQNRSTEYLTAFEKLLSRYSASPQKPILFIDIHEGDGCADGNAIIQTAYYTRLVMAIKKLMDTYNSYGWVYMQTNSRECCELGKKHVPQLKILLDGEITEDDIVYSKNNNLFGVASKNNSMTAAEMKLAHLKGLQVQLYGLVTKNDIMDALEKSPDFILVDNIPLAINVMKGID